MGGSGCNVDYRPNRREVGRKWYRYWSFSEEKKCGAAGVDGSGACLGFGKEFDDEPIEQCKRCIACTYFDWEEEKQRLSIEGRHRKRGRQ